MTIFLIGLRRVNDGSSLRVLRALCQYRTGTCQLGNMNIAIDTREISIPLSTLHTVTQKPDQVIEKLLNSNRSAIDQLATINYTISTLTKNIWEVRREEERKKGGGGEMWGANSISK
uniref:Uncharacterized protein n=1 Tax=Oryza rufipogon TaxID=4529 RepID=A0A0E0MVK0_ORYRU